MFQTIETRNKQKSACTTSRARPRILQILFLLFDLLWLYYGSSCRLMSRPWNTHWDSPDRRFDFVHQSSCVPGGIGTAGATGVTSCGTTIGAALLSSLAALASVAVAGAANAVRAVLAPVIAAAGAVPIFTVCETDGTPALLTPKTIQ